MLTREQRGDWQGLLWLPDRSLVLKGTQETLAIVDRHLRALEREHAAALTLRSPEGQKLFYTSSDGWNRLYQQWCKTVEAVEEGGEAKDGS